MTFLPKLLAIVAISLPPGSGERPQTARCTLATMPFSVWVPESVPASPAFTASHLPPPTESLFDRLGEMAYDEEDSTRVEDHGIVPLTLLDYGAPLASSSFSALAPASSHAQPVVIMPVLRC
jgi:hypothetical protein